MPGVSTLEQPHRSPWPALCFTALMCVSSACTGDITAPEDIDVQESVQDRARAGEQLAPSTASELEMVERELEESGEDFVNPERGYYVGKNLLDPGDMSGIHAAGYSLVIAVVRLDDYRDRPLDQAFFTALQAGFDAGAAAGIKYILRFSYNASFTDDAPLPIVLEHIEQLRPYLRANAPVISVLQAGFIGAWGEWHGSTNGLDDDGARAEILSALLAATPDDRFVQVRTPMYKDAAFPGGPVAATEAFTPALRARVGHHNDCFLASSSDFGTYAAPVPDWMSYVAQDTLHVPMGGETCSVHPDRTQCTTSLDEMERHHWSYLNSQYHTGVLDGWAASGCSDEIQRRLGYRLAVQRVRYPASVAPGATLPVDIEIANRGFAAPYNERPVYLVLTGSNGQRHTQRLSADPRRWYGGTTLNLQARVQLPPDLEPDSYALSLWMPDAAPGLADDPRRAIRLANPGVWNHDSGLNTLAELVVAPR